MHWILQNNLFNESAYQELLETLERFNLPYSIHKVIPFIGELTQPEAPVVEGPVICMGSYSMRHAAKKHQWYPGVFDLEPCNFIMQLQKWGSHMLNADSVVTTFENANFPLTSFCSAHQNYESTCEICKGSTRMVEDAFVRPIEDSKVFSGGVFTKEDFYTWKRKVVVLEEDFGNSLTKNTLVQVCNPKTILAEYRFWVVMNHDTGVSEIVCASLYKMGRTVMYKEVTRNEFGHLFEFVEARINEWSPHLAFVIDVCEVPNLMNIRYPGSDLQHELKIVEINTLNSSGFYACNIPKLVMALEETFG